MHRQKDYFCPVVAMTFSVRLKKIFQYMNKGCWKINEWISMDGFCWIFDMMFREPCGINVLKFSYFFFLVSRQNLFLPFINIRNKLKMHFFLTFVWNLPNFTHHGCIFFYISDCSLSLWMFIHNKETTRQTVWMRLRYLVRIYWTDIFESLETTRLSAT